MIDNDLLVLLHDWTVLAEYDAEYVVARCSVCDTEALLDTRSAA